MPWSSKIKSEFFPGGLSLAMHHIYYIARYTYAASSTCTSLVRGVAKKAWHLKISGSISWHRVPQVQWKAAQSQRRNRIVKSFKVSWILKLRVRSVVAGLTPPWPIKEVIIYARYLGRDSKVSTSFIGMMECCLLAHTCIRSGSWWGTICSEVQSHPWPALWEFSCPYSWFKRNPES